MRLDKFLKVSRLIKRRTLAKEATDSGKVSINGKDAKASTIVKVGDIITLNLKDDKSSYRIVAIYEYATEEKAKTMYERTEL